MLCLVDCSDQRRLGKFYTDDPSRIDGATPFQAFRHGRAYGILFHLEVIAPMVRRIVETFADEPRNAGLSVDDLLRDNEQRAARLEVIARQVFTRFVRRGL